MSTKTADPQGYSTKVTRLANGYGCRVLKDGEVVSEGHADTRADVGPTLRELLRMIDKCGNPSEMADASRTRNFCQSEKKS
jgi:hypothetical protein